MKPDPGALMADALIQLGKEKPLSGMQMTAVMESIVAGALSDGQIEQFLVALRDKGESVDEIAAAAKVMRRVAVPLPKKFPDLLDTCGTGGDNLKTLNVSTLSALVACSAGAQVAKHGNRSVSSVCGSADLLELLGVKVDLSPENVAACLTRTGFGFFFAPLFHPATRFAMPARKKIQGKTIFNLLGPLANPAQARYQLLGVYSSQLVKPMAQVLVQLGVERALVVHGHDGLDEISLSGKTSICEVKGKEILQYEVVPEDFNLKRESIESLRCMTKEAGRDAAIGVLKGDQNGAMKIVSLNAAAALYCCGKARSIKEGLLVAIDALESGKAQKKLTEVALFSQKVGL